MTGNWRGVLVVAAVAFAFSWAYSQTQKQNIPDAPSTVQPPQQFPNAAPAPKEQPRPAEETPPAGVPDPTAFPGDAGSTQTKADASTEGISTSRDEMFKVVSTVNYVQVPVTVKDENGNLVNGLLPKDFSVYENGEKQQMRFFTSDPFPLSAAVVVDLSMPDSAVQKVNQTFSSLEGAFSQFDEVSLYTYSGTVTKLTDFAAVNQQLSETLGELKTKRGASDGVPVVSGPLGPQGPTVNGRPIDPRVPTVSVPPKESHVINDAILAAALELSKRDRSRRKIIFVISNGREYRSAASYSDVLKVLLTNNIVVYGMQVGTTKIPGYDSLQKLHVPRFGTGDILPKYASATGGEVFPEGSAHDIGEVYARAMGNARNQYTLAYLSKSRAGGYREIEIRVARPDCKDYAPPCVTTSAKTGYYPSPPAAPSVR